MPSFYLRFPCFPHGRKMVFTVFPLKSKKYIFSHTAWPGRFRNKIRKKRRHFTCVFHVFHIYLRFPCFPHSRKIVFTLCWRLVGLLENCNLEKRRCVMQKNASQKCKKDAGAKTQCKKCKSLV